MKIRLIDGAAYSVERAEITNGRLEIDFSDKTAEEVQEILSVPANLAIIELLTDEGEKFGVLPGWSVYGGVTLVGNIRTGILSKAVDATEARLTSAEAAALEAKTIAQQQADSVELAKTASAISAQSFTDGEALSVKEIYPPWNGDGIAYAVGYKVLYTDILYKCLQAHSSQADWTPGAASSLWAKVLIPDSSAIPEWEQPESTNGYMAGDKVTHNGKTWESLVDNNVWEPGAIGTEALWQEVATA